MDAIVTAGGLPQPGDPLYDYTHGSSKAFLDIAGKPMIQWVLDALEGAENVGRIVIVGLTDSSQLHSSKLEAMLPSQGTMLDNLRAGGAKILELDPASEHVMTVSSDIPSIRPEMVDWVVRNSKMTDHDIYYHIITKEVMEARFPTSRRTYVKIKGMEVCGGDLNVVRTRQVLGKKELWDKIIAARKSPLKQATLVGFGTLLLLLLRALTIEHAEKTIARRLGVTARGVLCPYAEIGMDVDKPHQLEIMKADLGQPVTA